MFEPHPRKSTSRLCKEGEKVAVEEWGVELWAEQGLCSPSLLHRLGVRFGYLCDPCRVIWGQWGHWGDFRWFEVLSCLSGKWLHGTEERSREWRHGGPVPDPVPVALGSGPSCRDSGRPHRAFGDFLPSPFSRRSLLSPICLLEFLTDSQPRSRRSLSSEAATSWGARGRDASSRGSGEATERWSLSCA